MCVRACVCDFPFAKLFFPFVLLFVCPPLRMSGCSMKGGWCSRLRPRFLLFPPLKHGRARGRT